MLPPITLDPILWIVMSTGGRTGGHSTSGQDLVHPLLSSAVPRPSLHPCSLTPPTSSYLMSHWMRVPTRVRCVLWIEKLCSSWLQASNELSFLVVTSFTLTGFPIRGPAAAEGRGDPGRGIRANRTSSPTSHSPATGERPTTATTAATTAAGLHCTPCSSPQATRSETASPASNSCSSR